MPLLTVVAPLAGVVVTGEPTTIDAKNVILGSLNPVPCGKVGIVPCGKVGITVPSDSELKSPGLVGLSVVVLADVDVTGRGTDADTMLNLRVELGVSAAVKEIEIAFSLTVTCWFPFS